MWRLFCKFSTYPEQGLHFGAQNKYHTLLKSFRIIHLHSYKSAFKPGKITPRGAKRRRLIPGWCCLKIPLSASQQICSLFRLTWIIIAPIGAFRRLGFSNVMEQKRSNRAVEDALADWGEWTKNTTFSRVGSAVSGKSGCGKDRKTYSGRDGTVIMVVISAGAVCAVHGNGR